MSAAKKSTKKVAKTAKAAKKPAKKAAPKAVQPGSESDELKFVIDSAWERRTMLTPDELDGSTRPTVERVIDGIESAEFRVAEPDG